jgi:Transposase DDE domain
VGLLAQVHAVLVGMLRGHPDLILDSCSVRAKRAGDLTGPNPTDRAKRGTKYHVAVDGDGVPVACLATAANVNDTLVFERLFLAAFAVMARIRTVFADKPEFPRSAAHPGTFVDRIVSTTTCEQHQEADCPV